MLPIIINAFIFYLGWWTCVLLGNAGAGILLVMTLVVNSYLFKQPQREWWLWLVVGVLGFFNDALLLLAGIIIRPDGLWFPPFWLTCLWVLFAATLPYSMHGLVQRPRLFYVLCGLGGAVSYMAGVQLTSLTWGVLPWVGGLVLGVDWLIMGYILVKVMRLWRTQCFPHFIVT